MLYKIDINRNENQLKRISFYDLKKLEVSEKEFEGLLADNFVDLLYEEAPLMPIFRERSFKSEADLYALNEKGDLVLFELKLGKADDGAVEQILRYTEDAGQWTFNELAKKFKKYVEEDEENSSDLIQAHQESFELEQSLKPEDFNNNQHMIIIGKAADKKLIRNVNYWKDNGLSIDFIPYRIYEIDNNYYFEFFSPPYDQHHNPATSKGVLFDTNKKYDDDAVWHMIENNRVSAFGSKKHEVKYLNKKDTVFYTHKNCGIIAAAEVLSPVKEDKSNNEKYRKVKFITSVPDKKVGIKDYLTFKEVKELLDQNFFWRGIRKTPYLSNQESKLLVSKLKERKAED